MNLREPSTQKLVIFVIILILVLVAFFHFIHRPTRNRIKVLTEQRNKLQSEVQAAEAARARLPELQSKIARLEVEWERAQEMLPKAKEIPRLIQEISNSGAKAGVSFKLFKPSGPIPQKNYSEIPVQIKVECGYHQLGRFLSNVGNLARIVNVPSVKIKPGNKRTIEADLSAITYTVEKQKGVQRVAPRRQ